MELRRGSPRQEREAGAVPAGSDPPAGRDGTGGVGVAKRRGAGPAARTGQRRKMAAVVATDTQLMLGVGLIEKDTNGEVLWVWCYPSTTASLRNLLLRKCCLTDENKLLHPFVFGQYRRTWFYITTVEVPDASILKKVTHFSIVLTAKDFNPEKYAAFTRILCRIYLKHGSPVKMMESYIAVLTKGICQSEENGSFFSRDYDSRKAYLAGSIKDIVSQFGMETVILHTALMLKKRIVVYHPKIEAVQEFTRTLPALVWHRQDWTILHSYVHLHAEELEGLQMCTDSGQLALVNSRKNIPIVSECGCTPRGPEFLARAPPPSAPDLDLEISVRCSNLGLCLCLLSSPDEGYIAGFVELEVSNRPDLYDVFVNLADSEITIAPLAKEAMTMGKLHKEIGQLIVQSAEDPEKSDSQVIQDIALKTKEIFTNLAPFSEVSDDGGKIVLSVEALKQKRFPPATENFLYHLAAAEQMLKI
ncbi:Protein FAM45A [Microtus ochrogaster]|uniref:Protein FAM45A n=1 Tax=Microtus ochrogaster TaxID=79684 RepID=A0A8J6G4E8_MICOH|nr:Protein FAM45A [Microtus ochrogaster]